MCVVGSGLGMSQSSRLSSSVSAMRVLNTGSDVEEALADALVNMIHSQSHTGTLLTHHSHISLHGLFLKRLQTQNLMFSHLKKDKSLFCLYIYHSKV